jgi:hypothetical protein
MEKRYKILTEVESNEIYYTIYDRRTLGDIATCKSYVDAVNVAAALENWERACTYGN